MKIQTIAECMGARLVWIADQHAFAVQDSGTNAIYTNAYTAALQFGFVVIQKLYRRIERRPEWKHPHELEARRFYERYEAFFDVFDGED